MDGRIRKGIGPVSGEGKYRVKLCLEGSGVSVLLDL